MSSGLSVPARNPLVATLSTLFIGTRTRPPTQRARIVYRDEVSAEAGCAHAQTASGFGNTMGASFRCAELRSIVFTTKSVYTPIERQKDGIRILVTRYRGRGLKRGRYDVWMPNLGPSERLLRNIQAGKLTWAQFSRQYRHELFSASSLDKANRTIKNHGQKFTLRLLQALAKRGTITLMCHCAEDERHCHRHLLETLLRSKI
jgi:uncharacterized protein YeaO (DUF488 family)